MKRYKCYVVTFTYFVEVDAAKQDARDAVDWAMKNATKIYPQAYNVRPTTKRELEMPRV